MWTLSCSMWHLVPQPGIEHKPHELGVQSLNHWTTREVPKFIWKDKEFVKEVTAQTKKKERRQRYENRRSCLCDHQPLLLSEWLLFSTCTLLIPNHSQDKAKCCFLCEAFSDSSGRCGFSSSTVPNHKPDRAPWLFGSLILLQTCLVPNCGCPEKVNYFLFIWTFLAYKAVAGTWLDPQLFVIH